MGVGDKYLVKRERARRGYGTGEAVKRYKRSGFRISRCQHEGDNCVVDLEMNRDIRFISGITSAHSLRGRLKKP